MMAFHDSRGVRGKGVAGGRRGDPPILIRGGTDPSASISPTTLLSFHPLRLRRRRRCDPRSFPPLPPIIDEKRSEGWWSGTLSLSPDLLYSATASRQYAFRQLFRSRRPLRKLPAKHARKTTYREVDYNNALIVIPSSNDAVDIEGCPAICPSPSSLTPTAEQVSQDSQDRSQRDARQVDSICTIRDMYHYICLTLDRSINQRDNNVHDIIVTSERLSKDFGYLS